MRKRIEDNVLSVVINMIKAGSDISVLPNIIIESSSRKFSESIANGYYKELTKANKFPKFYKNKVCFSQAPLLAYRFYLDSLVNACEYQNTFYGVHLIHFDPEEQYREEFVLELVELINKSCDSAKYVLATPSVQLSDLFNEKCNCIKLNESELNLAYAYLEDYIVDSNMYLSVGEKKAIQKKLEKVSPDKWNAYLNSIAQEYYMSDDKEFITRIMENDFDKDKRRPIGFGM